MPFNFQDFLHDRIEGEHWGSHERISEVASVKSIGTKEVHEMFPNLQLSESNSVIYFPCRMCHTLPRVNKRGRCFTHRTLQNSVASAVDSLVDIDHYLKDHENSKEDRIIGHIKAAAFDARDLSSIVSMEAASVPSAPIPLYSLCALYLRADGVKDLVDNQLAGESEWKVSMECGHQWPDAHVVYRDEFIPITEAPGDMLDCIRKAATLPYKDHPLAVALGGMNGKVDFWGLGITMSPADEGCDVYSFVAGQSREAASRKFFRMPVFLGQGKTREVANEWADRKISELANIVVIGSTEPAEDGHTHEILSDLSILPANGHEHYIESRNVSRGTKPRFTGRTGSHSLYPTPTGYGVGTSAVVAHAHRIDLPLTGKVSSVNSGDSTDPASAETSSIPTKEKQQMDEILKQLNAVAAALEGLTKARTDEDRNRAISEIASVSTTFKELASKSTMKETIESEIKSRIDSGLLVTKEVADAATKEAVDKAVTEKDAEHKAALAESEKRGSRRSTIEKLGLVMDQIYDEELLGTDGKPLTVDQFLDTIPLDDAGDRQFGAISKLLAKVTAPTPAPAPEAPATSAGQRQEPVSAAAASVTVGGKVNRPPVLAGGGTASTTQGTHEAEVASVMKTLDEQHIPNTARDRGKYRFSN